MGATRTDTHHPLIWFMEKAHALWRHHYPCSRKKVCVVFAEHCRQHGQGGGTPFSKRSQAAHARAKAPFGVGWTSRTSSEDRAGIYRDTIFMAPRRAVPWVCAGTESHRILVGGDEKRYLGNLTDLTAIGTALRGCRRKIGDTTLLEGFLRASELFS